MFSTITYSNGFLEEETMVKELCNDRPKKRLACLECRARKVKCTGEKVGCQKCLENKIPCTYPESSRRSNARRKRTDESSKEDHGETGQTGSSKPSRSASSGPSSVYDYSLLSSTASDLDDTSILNFNVNDLFLHGIPFGDELSLNIDQLGTTLLEDISDYSSLNSSSELKPTLMAKVAKSHSMSDSSPLADLDVCNCAQSATQMLGNLDYKIANITDLTIDAILTDQNGALLQLNSWLICEQCDSPRATTKVIVLVIDGLCFCLERAVADYVRQLQSGVEEENQTLTGFCNIGEYHVNSWHEWIHILRVSLLCRCRDLQTAVENLQKRDVLSFLLKESEQKLTSMINQLKRCEGYL